MDAIFSVRMACDISHQSFPFLQLLVIFLQFWDRNSVVRRLKHSLTNFNKEIQRNKGVVFLEWKHRIQVQFRYQYRMWYFLSKKTTPLLRWISLLKLVSKCFSLLTTGLRSQNWRKMTSSWRNGTDWCDISHAILTQNMASIESP